jgi:UDP-2-acetamido-2-deoxy-ribo-hexuluronate aminotransferase
MEFIGLKYQYQLHKKEIDQAIQNVLDSGQFILGEEVERLEKALASRVKVKHCIATSSGTDSLVLALMSLGISKGDEVICVPFTWISPVETIRRLGATPVFVDIDPLTYVMDATKVEVAITKKTKAIIPVSLHGQMADFTLINKLAAKYNLTVIEDGAQSFGASQNGVPSCAVSKIGVTSFFPTKPLSCYGDGGAFFTNDDEIAYKVKAMRVHGAPVRFDHQYIGMNGRMDTLQAAIVLAKLPFLDEELEARGKIASYYNEHLKEFFEIPQLGKGNTHVYAQYVLKTENRKEVLKDLDRAKIPYSIYYPVCIHGQSAYLDLGYKEGDFPEAEKAASQTFSVPIHPWITQEDQDIIISTLKASVLQFA